MALNQARQERFLERQRGAGTRQIKDFAFDLKLPGQENAPLQPRKSGRSRKTPQPELLPPQRSSGRTPALEDTAQPLKPQRSGRRRKTPQPEPSLQEQSSNKTTARNDAPSKSSRGRSPVATNAKKRGRKPGRKLEEPTNRSLPPQSESEPETSRPIKKNGKVKEQPETITEEEEPPLSVQPSESTLPPKSLRQKGADGSVTKRKKRKSIGQQATKRKAQDASTKRINASTSKAKLDDDPLVESPVSADQLEDKIQQQLRRETANIKDRAEPAVVQSVETDEAQPSTNEVHLEPIPEKPENKTRKRKHAPVVQQANKRAKGRPPILHDEAAVEGQGILKSFKKGRRKDNAELDLPIVQNSTITEEEDPITSQQVEQSYGPGHEPEPPPWSPITAADENRAQTEEIAKAEKHSRPKRKKRRSIGQQKTRKSVVRASKPQNLTSKNQEISQAEPGPSKKTGQPKKSHVPIRDDEEDPEHTVDTEDNIETEVSAPQEPQIKRKRGRPKKADTLQTSKKSPSNPTTSKAQPPSKPTKQSKTASKPRAPTRSMVPITIYRPSPNNAYEIDEDDELANTATTSSKVVNAVDVLAQYTRELLPSISTKISTNPDLSSSQANRATKTVELFGTHLQTRLIQLSRVLDQNTTLGAQVKKVKQEERKLRKELKALEAERKGMDERKAEEEKEVKRVELQELLGRIGAVVKKGWAMEAGKHVDDKVHVTAGGKEVDVEA